MRQYLTNKAAEVAAYFQSYAREARFANKLLAFSSLNTQAEKINAKIDAVTKSSQVALNTSNISETKFKAMPNNTAAEKLEKAEFYSKYLSDFKKAQDSCRIPTARLNAQFSEVKSKIDALNLDQNSIDSAPKTWAAYAKAQAYVLPYNVAVCIKSAPAAALAKVTGVCKLANASNKNRGIAALCFVASAALVAGLVSGYRNQDAVISVGSDVLSKMLEGASKGASHALKVVAEQAATASAKLAR